MRYCLSVIPMDFSRLYSCIWTETWVNHEYGRRFRLALAFPILPLSRKLSKYKIANQGMTRMSIFHSNFLSSMVPKSSCESSERSLASDFVIDCVSMIKWLGELDWSFAKAKCMTSYSNREMVASDISTISQIHVSHTIRRSQVRVWILTWVTGGWEDVGYVAFRTRT